VLSPVFRFRRRKAWGFNSPPVHQLEIKEEPGTHTNTEVSATYGPKLDAL
jgi:hypothetical protein